MSWDDIDLPETKAKTPLAPVVASCGKRGRFRQSLRILVREKLLEGGLPWWRPGRWVRVQVGSGEHAGMLRITPADSPDLRRLQLRSTPGKNGDGVLVLHGYEPLPVQGQKAALEYDHADDWLEMTLPGWTRAAAPVTGKSAPVSATLSTPTRPAAAKTPFIGLGVQGHTETFAGRRGSAPIPTNGAAAGR